MRKIFLTSGLVVCMVCSAFADLTAPTTQYPNGTVEGSNPVATPYCTEPTLEGYSGTSTFTAKWKANAYDITYAPGAHGSGGQTLTDAATYNSNYTIRGLGSNTSTQSGVTANAGYHFVNWLGTSTGTSPDATVTKTTVPHLIALAVPRKFPAFWGGNSII